MNHDSDSLPKDQMTEPKDHWLSELIDWLKYILIAVLVGLLLVVFVVQRNSVIGHSMVPTLFQDDQLLVEKVSRWFSGIQYGDIVTIRTADLPNHDDEGPNIIKRVIGLPGDTIEIGSDGVYLNQALLYEPYLKPGTKTVVKNLKYEHVTLAENEYFVMGDNRGASFDSRSFGPVPYESIIGEMLFRFYPLDSIGVP